MVNQICEYPYQLRERNSYSGFSQSSKIVNQGFNNTSNFATTQEQPGNVELISQLRKKNHTAEVNQVYRNRGNGNRGGSQPLNKQIMYNGEHNLGVQSIFLIEISLGPAK